MVLNQLKKTLQCFFQGGGVLAHTILGVSFNERTGEIKYVHYVRLLLLYKYTCS